LTQTPIEPLLENTISIDFLDETQIGELGFGIKYVNDTVYYK